LIPGAVADVVMVDATAGEKKSGVKKMDPEAAAAAKAAAEAAKAKKAEEKAAEKAKKEEEKAKKAAEKEAKAAEKAEKEKEKEAAKAAKMVAQEAKAAEKAEKEKEKEAAKEAKEAAKEAKEAAKAAKEAEKAEKEKKAAEKAAEKEAKKDRPKKGKSSYMFFCEATRDEIKAANPDASGICEIAKLQGEAWKALGEEEKAKYVDMSKKDHERYVKEMEDKGLPLTSPPKPRSRKSDADASGGPAKKKKKKKEEEEERELTEEGLIAWYVPEGYEVQEEKPTPAELAFGDIAGDALVGRKVMYNWDEVGWCEGTVDERNTEEEEEMDGDTVNFKVYYPIDQNLSSHVLEEVDYAWGPEAAISSWVLLSAKRAEAAEA
jgi:hypothetical protein